MPFAPKYSHAISKTQGQSVTYLQYTDQNWEITAIQYYNLQTLLYLPIVHISLSREKKKRTKLDSALTQDCIYGQQFDPT